MAYIVITQRLDTGRYEVSLRIQSECGKMTTRITPNMGTFYAVMVKNEKLSAINIYNTWQTLGY